jgi:hypothetical protein
MEYRRRTLNAAFDEENPEIRLENGLWNMSIEEYNKYQYEGEFHFWRVIGRGIYSSFLSCLRYLSNQI